MGDRAAAVVQPQIWLNVDGYLVLWWSLASAPRGGERPPIPGIVGVLPTCCLLCSPWGMQVPALGCLEKPYFRQDLNHSLSCMAALTVWWVSKRFRTGVVSSEVPTVPCLPPKDRL